VVDAIVVGPALGDLISVMHEEGSHEKAFIQHSYSVQNNSKTPAAIISAFVDKAVEISVHDKLAVLTSSKPSLPPLSHFPVDEFTK
jgi:hypothetical protein